MLNGLDLFSDVCYINHMIGWPNKKREDHPCWKGGRIVDRDGYFRLYKPDHFWPRKGGYILEHVYLMEIKLGRRLQKGECVHHKDHNRQNNSLDNLELVQRWKHSKDHRKLDKHNLQKDSLGRFKSKCGST